MSILGRWTQRRGGLGDIEMCTRIATPLLEEGGLWSSWKPQWRATRSKSRICVVGDGLNSCRHMAWGRGWNAERR